MDGLGLVGRVKRNMEQPGQAKLTGNDVELLLKSCAAFFQSWFSAFNFGAVSAVTFLTARAKHYCNLGSDFFSYFLH